MSLNLQTLCGCKVAASDGDIGLVKDFYFDVKTWVVRYLVAETGSWLTGRSVLLSPHAFGRFEEIDGKVLLMNLTREEIENSPPIESDKPVSRQFEIEYYRYYGWPTYWNGDSIWGFSSYPAVLPSSRDELGTQQQYRHRDDNHLRSTCAVTGYHIQTIDGEIGRVSGVMVDDRSWAIRQLVVETGGWYSGREILIAHSKIERTSYEESKVFVNLTKKDIQRTPEYDLAEAAAESCGAENFRN
jgi:sporulation protein YlmC with PRC-barrel domain